MLNIELYSTIIVYNLMRLMDALTLSVWIHLNLTVIECEGHRLRVEIYSIFIEMAMEKNGMSQI